MAGCPDDGDEDEAGKESTGTALLEESLKGCRELQWTGKGTDIYFYSDLKLRVVSYMHIQSRQSSWSESNDYTPTTLRTISATKGRLSVLMPVTFSFTTIVAYWGNGELPRLLRSTLKSIHVSCTVSTCRRCGR